MKKATKFAERIRKVEEKAGAALMRAQEEIKWKVENWKVGDKVMLSMKDLVFKERLVKKLIERSVGPYEVEERVSKNAVKLKLPATIRIHPVVNIS